MKFKKKTFWIFLLVGLLGITPLVGYAAPADDKTSIEDIKKETRDLLKTLGTFTADQKDEALRKIKGALERLDKRLDALEARVDENWDKLDQAAREKSRASLKALRKQRNQAAEWYGRMKNSSGEAWEQMKKGFSDSYKSLQTAWEKSKKEFDSEK